MLKSEEEGGCRHLIKNSCELARIITAYPAEAPSLLAPVAEGGFRELINEGDDLASVIEDYPECAPELLKPIADGGRRELISHYHQLLSVIKASPASAPDLLKPQDEGGYQHLITHESPLTELIRLFPQCPHFLPEGYLSLLETGGCVLGILSGMLEHEQALKSNESAECGVELEAWRKLDLWKQLAPVAYLCYQPDDLVEYLFIKIKKALSELTVENSWDYIPYAVLDTSEVTSRPFDFSALSRFLDRHQEPEAKLLGAMILSNEHNEQFYDPTHPAYQDESGVSVENYWSGRLIRAAELLLSIPTNSQLPVNTHLFHLKLSFESRCKDLLDGSGDQSKELLEVREAYKKILRVLQPVVLQPTRVQDFIPKPAKRDPRLWRASSDAVQGRVAEGEPLAKKVYY